MRSIRLSRWKGLLFVAAVPFLIACSAGWKDSISGEEEEPALISADFVPFYSGSTTSYIRATSTCSGSNVIEFTFESSLTAKNTIYKDCSGGLAVQNLSVTQGTVSQLFSIKVVEYVAQPTTPSDFPYNLQFNFNPQVGNFGLTAGGKPISGGAISIVNNSIGEIFTGTASMATAKVRNGIQGTIDP